MRPNYKQQGMLILLKLMLTLLDPCSYHFSVMIFFIFPFVSLNFYVKCECSVVYLC